MLSSLNIPALLSPPAAEEFVALVPSTIVVVVAVAFIIIDIFHRQGTKRDYLAYFAVIGLGLVAASSWYLWDSGLERAAFFGMLYFDQFALFFATLASVAAAIAIMCSPRVLQSHRMDRGEYYLLILFSVAGAIVMAAAADFLAIFIALEIMSIPIYVVAGFLRQDVEGAEASMKYFILGTISAAVMLYGIALIYGATGTTNFEVVAQNLAFLGGETGHDGFGLVMVGLVMIVAGFIFKIAAVPFHVWAADVYSGSPTPAVGYMATAIKAAAFAGLIRVVVIAFPAEVLRGGIFGLGWVDIAFFAAITSMILGNVVAITQDNVKRMLAYSSIAHAGYILIGFVAANAHPEFYLHHDGILFYLVAYVFAVAGAFGVLAFFGRRGNAVETFEDLGNLGLKHPFMGLVMGVCMFSAAGFPPTAGFLGKFYIFRSGVDAYMQLGDTSLLALVVIGVLTSVVGAYYYLKVLVYMFMEPAKRQIEAFDHRATKVAVGICALMTLYIGIFPAKTIDLSRSAVMNMQGVPPTVERTIERGEAQLDELVGDEEGEQGEDGEYR